MSTRRRAPKSHGFKVGVPRKTLLKNPTGLLDWLFCNATVVRPVHGSLQKFHTRVQKCYMLLLKPFLGRYKAGLMGGDFIWLWFVVHREKMSQCFRIVK